MTKLSWLEKNRMHTSVPALLIIDMQKGMASVAAGSRNHPQAERNIAALLARWRELGAAVIHVRHISRAPDSPFAPGQAGADFQEQFMPDTSAHVGGGRMISFWAAEVYEREGGYFEVVGNDESILVQVDGIKPA